MTCRHLPWNWKTLAAWKESYDQPRQHIKKQRHHFANKVQLVKAMVFPVVLYGCQSWTIKKAKHRRIDAFELWCWWEDSLESLGTARRSIQSILKEISPEYSLEGLMLKLKLQFYGHLIWRTDSFEKTLMLGNTEGGMRRGRQRMRWLDVITNSMDMSLRKLQQLLHSIGSQKVGHNWDDWTELNCTECSGTKFNANQRDRNF